MMTRRLLCVGLLSTLIFACSGEGPSDTDTTPQDATTPVDASGEDAQAPTEDAQAPTEDAQASTDVATESAETQNEDTGTEEDDTEQAEESGCRSHADCPDGDDDGAYCATPFDDTHGCGVEPEHPDYPCEWPCSEDSGGEFPGGSACHAIMSGCASNGIGAYCSDPSENAVFNTPCGDSEPGGELTWNEEGVCVPQSCEDGYPCHAVQTCEPSAEHSDLHGCAFALCEADADCDAGLFCVNATCLDTLGTCEAVVIHP